MILITYGTRPEWIKIKPLINELDNSDIPFKVLFTGQHADLVPKSSDYNLTMINHPGNRLDSVVKNCLSIPDEYFNGITHVLVQGDTSSVMGIALTAVHRKIKVIHLEAGLRTYDYENPFPEEYNRRIVSTLSAIHLCPTELSKQNLINEKTQGDIHVVGNTVLDNLLEYKKECEYTNIVLITMHRRENHELMEDWFKNISELAIENPDLDFILPLHPNPNVQKHKSILTNINVIDPLTHEQLIKTLIKTRLVITDSGGIQEECSFFNKKAIVCRKITERPESVGTTSTMVGYPHDLKDAFYNIVNDYEIDAICPYGDGRSSNRIIKIFKTII